MTIIVINENHRPRAILSLRESEQVWDSYAMSEDLDHIKRFNHGNVYVKKGLASH
jgi:hypothetical protein